MYKSKHPDEAGIVDIEIRPDPRQDDLLAAEERPGYIIRTEVFEAKDLNEAGQLAPTLLAQALRERQEKNERSRAVQTPN